jgi:predicted acylesterase/phospholipase RssA
VNPVNEGGPIPSSSHFALVLPGAVARGAYEAGAIEVLAEQDTRIDRIVATSSGALNGLAYAAGIRSGREKEMAARLTESWINDGGWQSSFSLNPLSLIAGRGLSSSAGLMKMMRAMVQPCRNSKKREVEFRVLVTPLNGVIDSIGNRTATTYEHIVKFSGPDFDSEERLERVFKVVAAACAFPGLFRPVEIAGLGACVDGGAVNNAPIRYALEESDVSRVIMPVPYPPVMDAGDWKRGLGLLNHLIAILINERLFRDLKTAHSVNDEADQLRKMVKEGMITQEQFEKIVSVLSIRNIEITEIRPSQSLKSSPFSGFFSQKDRRCLIEAGKKAARETLAGFPQ